MNQNKYQNQLHYFYLRQRLKEQLFNKDNKFKKHIFIGTTYFDSNFFPVFFNYFMKYYLNSQNLYILRNSSSISTKWCFFQVQKFLIFL